jgi:hypothetical protein
MKREYIRPGLSGNFKKEMLGKGEVLINPDLEEVQKTLEQVQKSCRKNILTTDDVLDVWNQFHHEFVESPYVGDLSCPRNYGYDMEGSFIQIVELTSELMGVLIKREITPPGMRTIIPISVDIESKPRKWLNEVVTAFWTHLTDEDIELVYERALMQAMAPDEQDTSNSAHGYKRRLLQMQLLCRGNKPQFISELRNALQQIVAQMTVEERERIAWRDFQKKWPSLSARYQRDLLGLMRQGYLFSEDLLSYAAEDLDSRYQLSLDFWKGPQRTFPVCQILFRFGARHTWDTIAKKSLIHQDLVNHLMTFSENSLHPTTQYTVGWIRVHVDDTNRMCFIDEVQSDVMEFLYEEKTANEKTANVAVEILKEIDDWMMHGFATVQRWGHSIGYRTAIHSKESAFNCKNRDMTPSDRKWGTYYQLLIKHYKLELEQFNLYPGKIYVEKK